MFVAFLALPIAAYFYLPSDAMMSRGRIEVDRLVIGECLGPGGDRSQYCDCCRTYVYWHWIYGIASGLCEIHCNKNRGRVLTEGSGWLFFIRC